MQFRTRFHQEEQNRASASVQYNDNLSDQRHIEEQRRNDDLQRLRMEELKIAQFEASSLSNASGPLRQKETPTRNAPSSTSTSSRPGSPRSTATNLSDANAQKSPATAQTMPMMEISPGVTAQLRGVAEIREYVRRDEITPCLCFACELAMFTIADASYVLCPACRVVNPNQEVQEHEIQGVTSGSGGVGLGFTFQDLQKIQLEILQEGKSN